MLHIWQPEKRPDLINFKAEYYPDLAGKSPFLAINQPLQIFRHSGMFLAGNHACFRRRAQFMANKWILAKTCRYNNFYLGLVIQQFNHI